MPDYDIIIVGGRAAGSTLAARLGKMGVRVLLLERAQFPSLPAASSPIIYSSTMRLLDEIGAKESEYARNTPRIYEMFMDNDYFWTRIPIPDENGRNYAYAIDRARFDGALWDNALRFPTVEGRFGASVSDLLWDEGRLCGVVSSGESITADLVIGADGRFSTVARKAGAQLRDQYDEYPTTLLYAYWRGVQRYKNNAPTSVAYGSDQFGIGYLVMESADDSTVIVIEGQSRLMDFPGGQSEQFYLDTVYKNPKIAERLQDAEMVTNVRGMRDVGNYYRTAGGAGWALVGDAYLQEDPLDGQGIYNAVYAAKKLAQAIAHYRSGRKMWLQAVEWYDDAVRAETYYMYKTAIERVRTNLYEQPPAWVLQNLARWLMEDERNVDYLGRILTRGGSPNAMLLMAAPRMMGAVVRGGLRDLRNRVIERLPLANVLRGIVGE